MHLCKKLSLLAVLTSGLTVGLIFIFMPGFKVEAFEPHFPVVLSKIAPPVFVENKVQVQPPHYPVKVAASSNNSNTLVHTFKETLEILGQNSSKLFKKIAGLLKPKQITRTNLTAAVSQPIIQAVPQPLTPVTPEIKFTLPAPTIIRQTTVAQNLADDGWLNRIESVNEPTGSL